MLRQNINLPLEARVEALNTTGLVPSPSTGAVATTVLLFAGATTFVGPQGAVAIPSWLATSNDANQGTTVTITKPGIYMVELYLEQLADVDLVYGISQDVAVGGLTAVPSFATAGMLTVGRNNSAAAVGGEDRVPLPVRAPVMVGPELETGSVIRFHAALQAGGPPVDALAADSPGAYFRIRRINQLHQ